MISLHQLPTYFSVLLMMPLSIALLPTLLTKSLPTSITILLFPVHQLLPIYDESLLGTAPTISVSILPKLFFSASLRHSSYPLQLNFDSISLRSTESSSLLALSINSPLYWSPFMSTLASHAARDTWTLKSCLETGFIYRSFFSWSGQRRAVRLICDPSLTSSLRSLAHHRTVASLSLLSLLFWFLFFQTCSESSS